MLTETIVNCEKFEIKNVSVEKSDDSLSRINDKFDFVHSFVVIQHIKPAVGEKIFARLVEVLNDGGIGVLHVKYTNPGSMVSRIRYFLYRDFPMIYKIRNLVLQARKEPLIPVYNYNLNTIFKILQEHNCHKISIRFSDHGHYGLSIFFQKQKAFIY